MALILVLHASSQETYVGLASRGPRCWALSLSHFWICTHPPQKRYGFGVFQSGLGDLSLPLRFPLALGLYHGDGWNRIVDSSRIFWNTFSKSESGFEYCKLGPTEYFFRIQISPDSNLSDSFFQMPDWKTILQSSAKRSDSGSGMIQIFPNRAPRDSIFFNPDPSEIES